MRFALAALCAALLAATPASASIEIDLTGQGGPFDFQAPSGTAPIEPGSPLMLTITAASGALPGVIGTQVNGSGTTLGVNTLGITTGDNAAQIDSALGESLTFQFDFAGLLTGIDLIGVDGGSDFERLTITNTASSQSVSLVDAGAAAPAIGDLLLGTGDVLSAASNLLSLAFAANDPLVFTVDGPGADNENIGLESVTVIADAVPEATSFAIWGLLIGTAAAKRRRR